MNFKFFFPIFFVEFLLFLSGCVQLTGGPPLAVFSFDLENNRGQSSFELPLDSDEYLISLNVHYNFSRDFDHRNKREDGRVFEKFIYEDLVEVKVISPSGKVFEKDLRLSTRDGNEIKEPSLFGNIQFATLGNFLREEGQYTIKAINEGNDTLISKIELEIRKVDN